LAESTDRAGSASLTRESFERGLLTQTEDADIWRIFWALSRLLREYGYRLEECCNTDLTIPVMAQLRRKSRERLQLNMESFRVGDRGKVCPEVPSELLSAFFDGELTPAIEMTLQAHIESCDHCRQTLSAFSWLSEHLQIKERPAGRMGRIVCRHSNRDPNLITGLASGKKLLAPVEATDKNLSKKENIVFFPRPLKIMLPSAAGIADDYLVGNGIIFAHPVLRAFKNPALVEEGKRVASRLPVRFSSTFVQFAPPFRVFESPAPQTVRILPIVSSEEMMCPSSQSVIPVAIRLPLKNT